MKIKILFAIVWVALPIWLLSMTLSVSHSASGVYTTIQSAINASSPGDTVLVDYGRYIENLRVIGKSLTITSKYSPFTEDSRRITIIDGNQTGSCIVITDNANIKLENLYLTNGSGFRQYPDSPPVGGGIFCLDSVINITNCLIKKNYAVVSGGVVLNNSIATLSGMEISHNQTHHGGALSLGDSEVVFDPINLCSVFLNFGAYGNDIIFQAPGNNIVLDKFTVMHPDDEYLFSTIFAPISFSCRRAAIEQIPADLYVSTTGDDTNDGLTPDSPLKTIALALIKVKADSLNPRTIHLAEGTYSRSLNGQFLPLNMRSWVTISGDNEYRTILDGENKYPAAYGYNGERETGLKNLTIIRCGSEFGHGVITFSSRGYGNEDGSKSRMYSVNLENLRFLDCKIPLGTPNSATQMMNIITSYYADKASFKNIQILNCNGRFAFNILGGNTYAENILIDNYRPGNSESTGAGFMIGNSYYYPNYIENPNYFINIQISNSYSDEHFFGDSPMFCVGYHTYGASIPVENYLINATITDNICQYFNGSGVTVFDNGRLTMINSIIYHNFPRNVRLHASTDEPCRLRVLNCLIGDGADEGYTGFQNIGINNVQEWYGTNFRFDPLFIGTHNPNLYYLSSESPCVDAGTTDFSALEGLPRFSFPLYDLAGNPRVRGASIDMGAYEWSSTVDQDNALPVPNSTTLSIYPNPFVSNTTISYKLEKASDVVLEVYNTKGQRVKKLVNAKQAKGEQVIQWNGKDEAGRPSSTGIYLIRLTKDQEKTISKKVTRIQ